MKTILIVEDEDLVLSLVESVLQDAGYETISAGTVSDARAIIIDSKQRVDMVFTDIGLPNHLDGGVMVGRLAGRMRPGIPVLYTSGQQPVDAISSRFVERSGFLQKPYRNEDLVQAVAALCC